jgi:hypothetical protein
MGKVIFCFLLFSLMNGQKNIAGAYHVSSGNPDDGGYNWMLLENHNFAMATFGQIIAGKWSMDKDVITFTPIIPKYPFDVYGRVNPKVKGTKIMFSNFDINEDAYVGNSSEELQPVLNDDANCLPFPLLKEFDKPFKDLVLALPLSEKQETLSYTAELKKYNDFIIMYYSSRTRIPPFQAEYKNKKLYFRGDKASGEREEINPKDLKDLNKYMEQGITELSKETIVSNEQYNIDSFGMEGQEDFDKKSFLELNYNYNPSEEIYTAKYPRAVSEDDAYHDLNKLYQYNKIELKPSTVSYKVSKKSIFNVTCK